MTGILGESHFLLHFCHSRARAFPRVVGAGLQILFHSRWIAGDFLCARADWRALLFHRVVQPLLAVDAAPPGSSALYRNLLGRRRRAERIVQVIDVPDFRRARIAPPPALWTRDRGLDLP